MVIHEFAAPTAPPCPARCRESCSVFVHPLRVPIPSPNRRTKAVHEDARRLTEVFQAPALYSLQCLVRVRFACAL
jgi:hypothetical protein